MQYLIVMHQDGGCDYTIGCGCKVVLTEPNHKGIADALEGYLDPDVSPENRLSGVDVYEVTQEIPFDYHALRMALVEDRRAAEAAEEAEQAELAELERLEDKFGGQDDDELAREKAEYERLRCKYPRNY